MNYCFYVNSYKIFRCEILTLHTRTTDKCCNKRNTDL